MNGRRPTLGVEFDYVIVGGGTAGCVLAARLSEDSEVRVLLLEAGGEDSDPRFAVPGGQVWVRDWSQHAWMLKIEPDESLAGRSAVWRRGRGLGGSSVINGAIWAVGLPSDYDRWALASATDWDWNAVAPYFAKAEAYTGDSAARGHDGPIAVTPIVSPHPLAQALLESAASLHLPIVKDVNLMQASGIGLAQTNQRHGIRQSTARAYLKAARRRPNLTVLTHTTVDRLVVQDGTAVAVEYRHGGQLCNAAARREIILCAGAFNSPHLLLLSGIGAADALRAVGVPVVCDLPGVGADLQEHPEVYLEYAVRQRTYSTQMRSMGLIGAGLKYLFARRGPATSPATHVLGYLKTQPQLAVPDILLFAGPWGQLEGDGVFAHGRNLFSISPALCQPKSRGRITLRSSRPSDPPRIESNLLANAADVKTLIAGVRRADEIAATRPFADAVIERVSPGHAVALSDDAALEQWIRATVGICYHASSTCRMGSDPGAVVDADLRVRGVDRLRVCDTSVFPFVPSGNTAAPTVMVAERAADLIRAASR